MYKMRCMSKFLTMILQYMNPHLCAKWIPLVMQIPQSLPPTFYEGRTQPSKNQKIRDNQKDLQLMYVVDLNTRCVVSPKAN